MTYHEGQFVRFNMGYLARNWSHEGPREVGTVGRDENELAMVRVTFPSGARTCLACNLELVTEDNL